MHIYIYMAAILGIRFGQAVAEAKDDVLWEAFAELKRSAASISYNHLEVERI